MSLASQRLHSRRGYFVTSLPSDVLIDRHTCWFRLGESLMRVILPEDWYQIRRNGRLEWDDLGRQAYQNDLERYGDLDSIESRRRQSRLDFFLAEGQWMGCDSTPQAMSYAMEVVEEVERRERQVSDEG